MCGFDFIKVPKLVRYIKNQEHLSIKALWILANIQARQLKEKLIPNALVLPNIFGAFHIYTNQLSAAGHINPNLFIENFLSLVYHDQTGFIGIAILTQHRSKTATATFSTLKVASARFSTTLFAKNIFAPLDTFDRRHIGPEDVDLIKMYKVVGVKSMKELIDKTIPKSIHIAKPTRLGTPLSETETLKRIQEIASENKVFKSYIGLGYTGSTFFLKTATTPGVILRNVMENPGWYTQYTPYQPEIAQGRLESLLNFQTMVQDLTGMDVANASLLDEGTAAAESMLLCYSAANRKKNVFFVDHNCYPQTIACVQTRAVGFGIQVVVGDYASFDFASYKGNVVGALLQYPNITGSVLQYEEFVKKAHDNGALIACATDLLALTLLKAPGEFGADIAFGNSQRFGVPMGYGGPHAAFFAVKDGLKRRMPGRLIGVSKDAQGNMAYRLALQTREQHIRREKATSNICTAQALLANMAALYAVYHGPDVSHF